VRVDRWTKDETVPICDRLTLYLRMQIVRGEIRCANFPTIVFAGPELSERYGTLLNLDTVSTELHLGFFEDGTRSYLSADL
jgi:hypothetical protein